MENGYVEFQFFKICIQIHLSIDQVVKLKNLGPKLPFAMYGSTMIFSPTEKGVLIIGGNGIIENRTRIKYVSDLLELSGDSVETLEWKILEQKLQHPRSHHVSLSISNDIAATLSSKSHST